MRPLACALLANPSDAPFLDPSISPTSNIFQFANAAVACHFLLLHGPLRQHAPRWLDPSGAEATMYLLAEGPLAAALIAWQCSWVMGSVDHTTSVLVHLLPGLALFCHRWLAPASTLEGALTQAWAKATSAAGVSGGGYADSAAWGVR